MRPEEICELSTSESQSNTAESLPKEPLIRFREISSALEFIAWVMVALAPLLRLANGPPVTDDQAALQAIVAGLSLAGALGLRLYNWRIPLDSESR